MGHTMGLFLGIAVGIVIALTAWFLLSKVAADDPDDTQSSLLGKGEYDERQEVIRGRGSKQAYFGTLVGLGILFLMDLFWTGMPKSIYQLGVLFILFASVTYFAVYCIRNEAFMGITGQSKRYILLYALVVAVNVLSLAVNVPDLIRSGDLFGSVGVWMNLFCVLAFTIVLLALVMSSKKEADDEES